MTVHKSQGQSFDKVGVYLHSPVFVHGQLYVTLSRVRYANNLKDMLLTMATKESIRIVKYTQEVLCTMSYWNE